MGFNVLHWWWYGAVVDASGGADAVVEVVAVGGGVGGGPSPGPGGPVDGGADAVVEVVAVGGGRRVSIPGEAWAFVLDGHVFYVLSDVNGLTLVCDLTTGQWHHWYTGSERLQWNMYQGAMWKGRALAGDAASNKVWEVDPHSMLDEETQPIERVVTAYLPVRGTASVRQGSLRVTASVGYPTAESAVVKLRYTDDGGASWSPTYERTLVDGDFDQMLNFRSLGRIRAPGRVWEISDVGGLVRIEGADSDIEGGDE